MSVDFAMNVRSKHLSVTSSVDLQDTVLGKRTIA